MYLGLASPIVSYANFELSDAASLSELYGLQIALHLAIYTLRAEAGPGWELLHYFAPARLKFGVGSSQ